MSQEEQDRSLLDLVKRFDEARHDWLLLRSDLDQARAVYRQILDHIEEACNRIRHGLSTKPPREQDVPSYADILRMLSDYEQRERQAFDLSVQLKNLGHDVLFPPQ